METNVRTVNRKLAYPNLGFIIVAVAIRSSSDDKTVHNKCWDV